MRMFQSFIVAALIAGAPVQAQDVPAAAPAMSFFVTSTGRGFGGNLGGLAGADALCRQRAAAVGRGDRLWRAYLSAPPSADAPAVHARDRIGRGPWVNAHGIQIAASVEDLHREDVNLTRDTALTEEGAGVWHRTDTTSLPAATPTAHWSWMATRRAVGGRAMGRAGRWWGITTAAAAAAAIPGILPTLSRGCSQAALRASLGDGLLYCFAAD